MPTTPPAQPMPGLRERKKARTKAAIQREALRLFSRHGYAETSVDQIAAAAEVSPSTFFRYFATKEDVVLADFIDSTAVMRVIEAPAELGPLQALKHAISEVMGDMADEDMELELLRNKLIQNVPELRRGLISEMVRPMRLYAGALSQRLGRPADDPDLLLFAGAVIGALIFSVSPEDDTLATQSETSQTSVALDRLDRLGLMLTLPPP